MNVQRWMLLVSGAALLASCAAADRRMASNVGPDVPLVTPEGVTIQDTGAPFANQGGYERPTTGAVYADAKGLTLYTSDNDPEGLSACVGECTASHPPFLATPNTAAPPGWSVITRKDGLKQWAFAGKALYTSSKDTRFGQVSGRDPQQGWRTAALEPGKGVALPAGINVTELMNAAGHALVSDAGQPLYAFDGDPWRDASACVAAYCANQWQPLLASQLARPVGDFNTVSGNGVTQWAYRGRPLFTFEGDRKPGDANGSAADPRWRVALVARYFMPAGVAPAPNHFGGFHLVDGRGMTLYQRGRWRAVNGGAVVSAGTRDHPFTGRLLGTSTCDVVCARTWHPLAAPEGARPSAYWDVVIREDGSRQWAYQGYPLYTYSGDRGPGSMAGNDITDYMPLGGKDVFLIADQRGRLEGGGTGAPAMYWHVTLP